MNKVCLLGRLTRDPELRKNSKGVSTVRFTVAANRNYKNDQGEYDADFITCVAWRERAELISKFFSKGSQIALVGHIQTGSYEKENGDRVYISDVIVDSIDFISSNKTNEKSTPEYTNEYEESFIDDSDLPF